MYTEIDPLFESNKIHYNIRILPLCDNIEATLRVLHFRVGYFKLHILKNCQYL